MYLEMPPQQRQIISAAVGPDLGTAFAQWFEVARRRQILANTRTKFGVVGIVVENIDDAVKRIDQAFHLFALTCLDLLQLFPGPLVDCAHTTDEHLGQVVAGSPRI